MFSFIFLYAFHGEVYDMGGMMQLIPEETIWMYFFCLSLPDTCAVNLIIFINLVLILFLLAPV